MLDTISVQQKKEKGAPALDKPVGRSPMSLVVQDSVPPAESLDLLKLGHLKCFFKNADSWALPFNNLSSVGLTVVQKNH